MKPAIRVERLSKHYRVGSKSEGENYQTLREAVNSSALASWRGVRRLLGAAGRSAGRHGPGTDSFAALDDVSFDVQPGEVVGIIGRNGAGKSTLLKILSNITEPTSGRILYRGRIASLLEVGTGFHPELTGRENIYLNGSILGMTRSEISRKFDEIVAFAEIERFLDTPVKRYSSGMYVRLAFAVAAHLEPEILVVDEVLAVGDQEFQRKCIGKMSEIAQADRTILFVSHNMAAVQNLCKRVAVLEAGRLAHFGDTREAVERYVKGGVTSRQSHVDLGDHPNRRLGTIAIFRSLSILDGNGQPVTQLRCGDSMGLEFVVDPGAAQQMHYGFWVEDSMGVRLFTVGTHLSDSELPAPGGLCRLRCELGPLMLAPGQYHLSLVAGPIYHMADDVIDKAATFEILAADVHGNGRLPKPSQGLFVVRSTWSAEDE